MNLQQTPWLMTVTVYFLALVRLCFSKDGARSPTTDLLPMFSLNQHLHPSRGSCQTLSSCLSIRASLLFLSFISKTVQLFSSLSCLLWHDNSHRVCCVLENGLLNQRKVGEPQQTFNYCIVIRCHERKSAVGPGSVQIDEIETKIGL